MKIKANLMGKEAMDEMPAEAIGILGGVLHETPLAAYLEIETGTSLPVLPPEARKFFVQGVEALLHQFGSTLLAAIYHDQAMVALGIPEFTASKLLSTSLEDIHDKIGSYIETMHPLLEGLEEDLEERP